MTGLTLVVVVGLGFQLFLDTGGIDNDCRFALNRTLVLTDTASSALLFFDHRALLVVTHNRLIRALLIADKADLLRIPCNTSGLVDMGDPYLDEAFFFKGNRLNGFNRADPSAKIAELFAVTDAWDKPRRVKTG